MSNFPEKMGLKERAEEDIYFARLDRELIAALHRNNMERLFKSDSPEAIKLADSHLKDHEKLAKSYVRLLKKIVRK